MTKRAAEQLVTCQDSILTYNFTLHHLLHPFELRVPNDRLLTCLRRLKTSNSLSSHTILSFTMAVPTAAFKNWLKTSGNMKLSSNAAVLRLTKEGITNFESLTDFDKKSMERLPATCKETIAQIARDRANNIPAENEVPGANISSISVRRLIVAMNASEYYSSIGRVMTIDNMNYDNILKNFKIEWDTYQDLRDQDAPDVPLISDKENDRKVIKWVPVFHDCLARSYGINGPLSYVLREESDVPDEATDPLEPDSYYGASGSLHEELTARLPHSGPIYKNDNCSVFLKIEKASRGTLSLIHI